MKKTLFLTGASGDIGGAIKIFFEQKGYTVIAPARKELDLARPESIAEYFEGRSFDIDTIIHCAGINDPQLLEDLTLENVQRTAQVNYMSFFEIVKYLAPSMKKKQRGHILGISSVYGTIGRRGRLAYAASKHALNGVVKTLACELGEHNIMVNALSPGFVETQLTRKNNSAEMIELLRRKIPLKRLASPEDIARVAFALCSDLNTYISGQDIVADGGFLAEGGQNS
ncbi:MAG: SDR family oxidoreductase [Methanomassiliicoccaceae archaeon]|jgi:3-oxoacyl-[acyl-carrier protein] reductase|nr:SDR family oxidoreductase [Methanomassiliicoccaceae archaeon]